MARRDSSEVDEIDEDVSDRLFSLDEIMSDSEVEEVEVDEGTMSEDEREELLREVHDSVKVISPKTGEEIDPEEVCRLYKDGMSLKKVGEHFGFKDGRKPMKRILKACGVEIRSVGFQEIEIDPEELYRLYFGEGMGLNECAEHFQCKSTDPILRVFRKEGWKTRYQETYEKEIDPEEVFRLYDEGMSIRKIGDHYGVSYGRIHREFIEHDKEYGQEIQVDPEVIHGLYFGEGLSRDEVCETLGFSRKVFNRILKEQEWEARPAGFQPLEIDIEEFKRLYHEGLTYKQLADHFQMSLRTVSRVSSEIELEVRKWPARNRVDLDELYRMYHEDEEKMWKIAEHFGVSQRIINIILNEQNWEKRKTKSAREIRDEMFGTECVSCGKPKEIVHRKDGTPHHRRVTWAKKSLKTLDPDDWVSLCEPCHRLTHSLMTSFSCEWKDIERILQELARKWLS
ncbi:MAG: hypothetical protein ACXAAO_13260 [Candidatus Thorarchaeota archaeon]